jgi:radical SAM protein with 4Fe4S-binding SPASM domain
VDAKTLIKNKSICTLPWTGFQLDPNGDVKNCIMSNEILGNIDQTHIKDIMAGSKNLNLKKDMLADRKPKNCSGCYLQEKGTTNLSSISSRLYYLREIGAKVDLNLYDKPNNFSLKHVDLRWTNSCNQACVYCSPNASSKWAQEMGVKVKSKKESRQEVKDFVFENVSDLKNVYLAGGEPMLMKENYEFLKLLKVKNPNCNIRVNTNLSTTGTGIFELLCTFNNVHWIISVDSMEQEYEYIRHHGSWKDFLHNLEIVRKLNHKISFNMLHFILNYVSVHDCIDLLKAKGFHDNSFIMGPLYTPMYYNILNLPEHMIKQTVDLLQQKLNQNPLGYLKNSYENCLKYLSNTQWDKNINSFYENIKILDGRRGVDSKKTFTRLFEELDANTVE